MKNLKTRGAALAAILTATMALGACTTDEFIDNTVDVAAGTTKVVTKGVVGAGKLVYKGGKALVAPDSE